MGGFFGLGSCSYWGCPEEYRGVVVDHCYLCKQDGESINHILLHCFAARDLWSFLFVVFGISWILTSFRLELESWLTPDRKINKKWAWKAAPICLGSTIWKEHNSRAFEGVVGIADEHALQLITKFGTLENVLQYVDEVEEETIREALISNSEKAILSKNLAMLRSDLPFYMVPFITDDLIFKKPKDDGEKFTSLLRAISAYSEGFSADFIINRACLVWQRLMI